MKSLAKYTVIVFATLIGLYPLAYLLSDMDQGLLNTKLPEVISSSTWRLFFFTHIYLGGFALLIGWSQFMKKWRNKRLNWHRNLGKVYMLAILFSGISGLYISFFATGGIIAKIGFGALAVFWLVTVTLAYISIRDKNIDQHRKWMVRNYALTFAAVTLRFWLPLFTQAFEIQFIPAYQTIAWLCWVPNLLVAEIIISKTTVKS